MTGHAKHFVIERDQSGEWHWTLDAANARKVARSAHDCTVDGSFTGWPASPLTLALSPLRGEGREARRQSMLLWPNERALVAENQSTQQNKISAGL